MDPIDDIFARIKALAPDEAMEAALTLRDSFGLDDAAEDDGAHDRDATDAAKVVDSYVAEVEKTPDAFRSEAEDLARLVLLAGAADPELRPVVVEALDAVGQRNIILGGAEIVALAALGTFVFTSVQSRGIASTEESIEINQDGSVKYKKKIVTTAGSGVIGKLLSFLRPH